MYNKSKDRQADDDLSLESQVEGYVLREKGRGNETTPPPPRKRGKERFIYEIW